MKMSLVISIRNKQVLFMRYTVRKKGSKKLTLTGPMKARRSEENLEELI